MSVRSISPQDRDEIFCRTRDKVLEEQGSLVGQCLSFAWHGYETIRSYPNAPQVVIQAGSASWPRIPMEHDDGKIMTHLSYQFEFDSASTTQFLGKLLGVSENSEEDTPYSLPEIHIWLALPESKELVDFTIGTWPLACEGILGEPWLAPPPPEYFWGSVLPPFVRYVPNWRATVLMFELLLAQGRIYP